MQKNFIQRSIEDLTDSQIQELRKDSIGGSDIATVLGLNPYKSRYELWGEKTGLYTPNRIENEAMFFGNYLEDKIREFFEYWEKGFQQTLQNFKSKRKIYKVQKPNYIAISKKHSFLSASLDGIIEDTNELVEFKTISKFMFDKFEHGIPPYHFMQLQHYFVVTGYESGYLVLLVGGREFYVFKVVRDKELGQTIIEEASKFWEFVINAKEKIKQGKQHEIVEPPLDGSDAEANYLQNKYNDVDNSVMLIADKKDCKTFQKLLRISHNRDALEAQCVFFKNKLKQKIGDKGGMIFQGAGEITWKQTKRNYRTFKIKTYG